jgi:hypothetical protein
MVKQFKALFIYLLLLVSAKTTLAQNLPRVDFMCQDCQPAAALARLSQQSGVNIAFSDRLFTDCPPVTIFVQDEALTNIIERICACARLSYKVDEGQVVIYRRVRRFTLSGFIQDAETGERLIGVSLRLFPKSEVVAVSNEFGFFSMKLEEGDYTLAALYIGYQFHQERVLIDGDRMITLQMNADNRLPEVIISSLPGAVTRERLLGAPKDLPMEQLKHLPMPGGEADVLRLAAFQPGVQTGVDGMGGLHVRGGNADQNLFLLDDVPVYSPGHALGLFSVYNPTTVSSARLWKGDAPARFGGRISSVLDVRTRDGNNKNYEGNAHAGLFAASASVEGPIIKEKCSFLLGARTTYFEPWVAFFSKRGNLLNIAGDDIRYRYFDANVKLSYLVSTKDKVYFSYYQGGDFFKNNFDQDYTTSKGLVIDTYDVNTEWGNSIASFRWNHLLNPKLFSNTTIRYSQFLYRSRLGFDSRIYYFTGRDAVLSNYAQLYQTLIRDWSGKSDFTYYFNSEAKLRWGMSFTAHQFQPGAISASFLQQGESQGGIDSLNNLLINNELLDAKEAEAYLDLDTRIGKEFRLEAGFNASVFQSRNASYRAVQPRFRFQHDAAGGFSQWIGAHRNVQYLHQIGTFNISLPFELWVPSTRIVRPETSWQYTAGLGFQKNGWAVQLEGYYKNMERVLTFLAGNDALYTGGAVDASGWEDRIAEGTGLSRGLEFTLEKNKGNLTGQIAYTLSRTERTFPELNSGRTFPFRFDRRHDFKISLRQRLFPWVDISSIWVFATGNPITLAGVKFRHETVDSGVERDVYVYTEMNGYRLPNYHRLDLALNFHFGTRQLRHEIQIGVYNAYNRANPFFLFVDGGSSIQGSAIQYTLLPVLPSFRYQLHF